MKAPPAALPPSFPHTLSSPLSISPSLSFTPSFPQLPHSLFSPLSPSLLSTLLFLLPKLLARTYVIISSPLTCLSHIRHLLLYFSGSFFPLPYICITIFADLCSIYHARCRWQRHCYGLISYIRILQFVLVSELQFRARGKGSRTGMDGLGRYRPAREAVVRK